MSTFRMFKKGKDEIRRQLRESPYKNNDTGKLRQREIKKLCRRKRCLTISVGIAISPGNYVIVALFS